MEPKKFDGERFLKFFRLIGSDNDGEILAAVRACRKMLVAHGVGWTQFVDGNVKVETETTGDDLNEWLMEELKNQAKNRHPQAEEDVIDEMLRKVFNL